MNKTYRPTLLYSGGCKFCRWVVRTIIPRLDSSRLLDVLPLRDQFAWRVLLEDVPVEERNQNWWFRDAHGKLWAGNQGGGLALLSALPRTRVVGNVGRLLGLSPLVDRLDRWVKRNRPLFSRFVKDGPMLYRLDGKTSIRFYGWQVAPDGISVGCASTRTMEVDSGLAFDYHD